jgi:type I restriction enzyme, S subunit
VSFPRYAKYKPSGLDWLVEVPAHWGAGPLRWLARRYSGGTPDKTNLAYWTDGTIPWLNSGAVNDRVIKEPSAYITADAFENSSVKWIPEGALVMALAGQGKTKGMVARLTIRTTCNQSMAAIIPGTEVSGPFLYWWLDSNYQNIRNMAGGDLRDGLNLELLGNIQCPIPPPAEQLQIAAFLNREAEKIDGLVAEQQRLIELKKEKRQSVISHAVTKGVNPYAPMKPSGIGWLGHVPTHWAVVGLTKYLASVVDYRGRTPTKVDDGVFLVTARNIRDGKIDYSVSEEYINPSEYDDVMRRGSLQNGDVLFTTEAPLGEVANVDRTDVALAQRVIKLRGQAGILDNYFLKYWMMGSFCQADMKRLATGSTALGIKGSKVVQLRLCLPPHDEQVAIVRHLDRALATFDALTAEAQRAIDLLQERRTALIAAAVTGKIDVRGLVEIEAA